MERVFSGIQPSGVPTLGNYLGAIRNWVALQNDFKSLFCVVNLHALTVYQNPNVLRQNTLEMVATLLACGIDPRKSNVFKQSDVAAHARLGWIFNCVVRVGWLNRMAQFKDKTGNDREGASLGLYGYPALMAADICAYHAQYVPVGDDQKQHIELANDIVEKFNHDFGVNFFPKITALMTQTSRVMSLRDGKKKMSKSDASDQSRINLTDDADAIAIKIKRATTDPAVLPEHGPMDWEARPEASNLVAIYAAITGNSEEAVLNRFGGKGFGVFKPALTEVLVEHIVPIGEKIKQLLGDISYLEAVLSCGADQASAIANPIVTEAERIVGLR